ncbi:hypothetical protein C1645_819547 [Glomus cerebriforme]|uniref:Uncharacterized protein n=1 Tax=Glomus cerebriforme TaxID=658196 RepID=A0A397TEP0_9GLOM|nr:hypothetical protein C1645_819547 [Glomus cerebriforme]
MDFYRITANICDCSVLDGDDVIMFEKKEFNYIKKCKCSLCDKEIDPTRTKSDYEALMKDMKAPQPSANLAMRIMLDGRPLKDLDNVKPCQNKFFIITEEFTELVDKELKMCNEHYKELKMYLKEVKQNLERTRWLEEQFRSLLSQYSSILSENNGRDHQYLTSKKTELETELNYPPRTDLEYANDVENVNTVELIPDEELVNELKRRLGHPEGGGSNKKFGLLIRGFMTRNLSKDAEGLVEIELDGNEEENIKTLQRDELNQFQKYYFFNEAQVLEKLKPLLVRENLTILISDDQEYQETVEKQNTPYGINDDPAKAKGSADTYAVKYALSKLFLFPVKDTNDPDYTPSYDDPKRPLTTEERKIVNDTLKKHGQCLQHPPPKPDTPELRTINPASLNSSVSVASPATVATPPVPIAEYVIAAPNGGQKKVVTPNAAVSPIPVNVLAAASLEELLPMVVKKSLNVER